MPRCICNGQGALLFGMGKVAAPLNVAPGCPVHGAAAGGAPEPAQEPLARAEVHGGAVCCDYHRRHPDRPDHYCARLTGREPDQHFQPLDLTCAVCGYTPCPTPERCSAEARSWGQPARAAAPELPSLPTLVRWLLSTGNAALALADRPGDPQARQSFREVAKEAHRLLGAHLQEGAP